MVICNPPTFERSYICCDEVDIWAEVQRIRRFNFVYVWNSGIISRWWNHNTWLGWKHKLHSYLFFAKQNIKTTHSWGEWSEWGQKFASQPSRPCNSEFQLWFFLIWFSFFPHKRWKSWWRWWKLLGRWDHRWLIIDQVSHTTRALLCQGFWSVVVPPLIPVINYFATPGVWTIILPPLLLWSIILPCTLLFNWYVILMTFLQLQAVHLLNPPSLVEGVLGLVRDGSRHQNG